MGINDEYSRDAYQYEQSWDSDDSDEFDLQVDPEDWQAIYSEELLNAWMTIRVWHEDRYLPLQVTYNSFTGFVLNPFPWYTHASGPMSIACSTIWDEISKIKVISERVVPEQFWGWFKHNIEKR